MNAPPSLLWELTKKHNAFLVKSNNITLSCEPGNITNIRSSKASGLAQDKAIGYQRNKKNGKVQLVLKRQGMANKPKQSRQVIHLSTNNPTKSTNIVKKHVANTYYRRDEMNDVLNRVAKLTRAENRAALIKTGALKVVFGRNKMKQVKEEQAVIRKLVEEKKKEGQTETKKDEVMATPDDDGPPGLDGAQDDDGPPGLD
jgi:large subunit ribosomal protein L28e